MRLRHWMPIYWGDYFQDTNHLTALEHGAYLLLIARYWTQGGPIPDDDSILSRAARVGPRQWARVRCILAPFFTIADGVWRHRRIDQELQSTELFAARQSAAGKASALKRLNSRSTTVEPRFNHGSTNHSHSHIHSDPPPLSPPLAPATPSPNKKGTRLPADWTLSEEWKQAGVAARAKAGLPAINLDVEADRFRDYWTARAGQRGAMLDWLATWRNWCRNARGSPAGYVNGHDKQAEQAAREARIDAMAAEVRAKMAAKKGAVQ